MDKKEFKRLPQETKDLILTMRNAGHTNLEIVKELNKGGHTLYGNHWKYEASVSKAAKYMGLPMRKEMKRKYTRRVQTPRAINQDDSSSRMAAIEAVMKTDMATNLKVEVLRALTNA